MFFNDTATTETQGAAQIVDFYANYTDQDGIPIGSPGDLVLTEDGQALMDETGQRITQKNPKITADDGTTILTEDGQRLNE